jgi:hypothetical protein
MTTMITSQTTPDRVALNPPDRRVRGIAVGGALLATGLLWLAAHALGITLKVDLHNGRPPQVFGLAFLLGFALLFSLLGWASLAILEHYTRRALRIWTSLGVTVLAVSFVPLAAVGATASAKTVLCLIHLALAAVLLSTMRRSYARRNRTSHHPARSLP